MYKYSQLEHLKLIEQQIQRMSDDSFKIKSWSLTVIGSALLYWLKGQNSKDVLIMFELFVLILTITIVFWLLDAYYLSLEQSYRELYSDVQTSKVKNSYTLNIQKYQKKKRLICLALCSKPLKHTYLVLILFELLVFIFRYVKF